MSTSVENHIVKMEFDNKNFEQGAQETLNSIEKLKESIKFEGAAQGLDELSNSIKNVNVDSLSKAADEASNSFSKMEVFALTALVRISNALIDVGKKIGSAIIAPLNQIKTGGWSRAMNLENAKFQLEGLKMDVAAVMKDVDYAVSGTAYSLDAAAKAAASLGASGVKAGDQLGGMARSLRAISGVAAMTNSDYESIAQIFATIAGNGKLMTMQLRQFSARGLNVAAELAKQMGVTEQAINEMVTKGQIDFQTFQEAMMEAFGEHAVKANETFTGALANVKSALSRVGEVFATPIIQNAIPVLNSVRVAINEINKEVKKLFGDTTSFGKTIAGPFRRLMEYISSGLTEFFSSNNFINAGKAVVRGLSNIFNTLLEIILRVKAAWQNVFPSETAGRTLKAASAFEKFTEIIRDFVYTVGPAFQSVMEAFFQIFKAVSSVIKAAFTALSPLGNVLLIIANVISVLVGHLGRLISNLLGTIDVSRAFAVIGNIIKTAITGIVWGIQQLIDGLIALNNKIPIFTYMWNGIQVVIGGISALVNWIIKLINTPLDQWGNIFSNLGQSIVNAFNSFKELDIVKSIISTINNVLSYLGLSIEKIGNAVKNFGLVIADFFVKVFNGVKDSGISYVIDGIVEKITYLKDAIVGFFREGGFSNLFKGADGATSRFSGILGALTERFRDFADKVTLGKVAVVAFAASIIALVSGIAKSAFAFSGLIGSLTDISTAIKGVFTGALREDKPIMSIAKAVFLFAAALLALSLVPADRLGEIAKTMVLFTAVMGGIGASMGIIAKFTKAESAMRAMATTILAFGLSITMMTAALTAMGVAFSNMKNGWDVVPMILVTFGGLVATVVTGMALLAKFAPKLSVGSIALLAFAIAMKMIIGTLSEINWQGFNGVTVEMALAIAALGGAIVLMAPTISAVERLVKGLGVAVLGISAGIYILVRTIDFINKAQWSDEGLKRAAIVVGSLLALFIVFGRLMKGSTQIKGLVQVLGTVTVCVVALALVSRVIGSLDGAAMAKGLVVIGTLMAFFAGLILVSKTTKDVDVKGITAIVVGVVVLCGTLIFLTLIDWQDLLAGVLGLSAVMLAFGGAIMMISKFKFNLSGIVAIVGVLGALAGVIAGLILLKDVPWENLLAAGLAMTLTMLAFGKAVEYIARSSLAETSTATLLKTTGVVLVSMLLVAGIMERLSLIPWQSLVGTGAALSMCLIAFGSACRLISGFKLEKGQILKLVVVLGLMAGVATILAVLNTYNNDWTQFIGTAAAISLSFVAFGLACKLISGFNLDAGQFAKLFAVLGLMVGVGLIIKMFETSAWQEFAITAGVMSLAFVAFGAAAKLISGFNIGWKEIAKLIIIFGAMAALTQTIKNLAGEPWEQILAAAGAMAIALGAIALVLVVLDKALKDSKKTIANVAAMVVMSVNLVILAMALKQFADIGWEDMGKAGAAIAAITLVLIALSKMSAEGLGALASAGAIAVLALGLYGIAQAVKAFEGVEWTTLAMAGVVLVALGVAVGALSAATGMGAGAVLVSAALVGIAFAIGLMATSLQEFSKVSMGDILALIPLGIGIAALGLAGVAALLGVAGLIAFGNAITVLSAGLLAYSAVPEGTQAGLYGLAPALILLGVSGLLAGLGASGLEEVGNALIVLSAGLAAYAPYQEVSLADLAGGIALLAASEYSLVGGLGWIAEEIPRALNAISEALAKFPTGFDWNCFSLMATGIGQLASVELMLSAGVDNLVRLAGEVMPMFAASAPMFVMGLTMMSMALMTFATYIENTLPRIISLFEETQKKMSTLAISFVSDLTANLIEGFTGNSALLYSEAAKFFIQIEKALRDTFDWNSPIPLFVEFGEQMGADFENAFSDVGGMYDMVKSQIDAGIKQPIVDSLKETSMDISTMVANIKTILSSLGDAAIRLRAEHNRLLAVDLNYQEEFALNSGQNYEKLKRQDKAYLDSITDSAEKRLAMQDLQKRADRETTDQMIMNLDRRMGAVKSEMDLLEFNGNVLEKNEEKTKEFNDAVKDLSESMAGNSSSGGGGGSLKESTEEATDALLEFVDAMAQAIESQLNIFEKFQKKDPMSPDQMLENMRSQVNGVKNWAVQMQQLGQMGISNGLLEELGKLGPQGADKVAAFVGMTAEQLAEANALFAESMVLPDAVANQLGLSFQQMGRDFTNGLAIGLADPAAVNQMSATALAVVDQGNSDLGNGSPSWKARQSGVWFIMGLNEGLKLTANVLIYPLVENIAEQIVSILEEGLHPSVGEEIGAALMEGLAEGVSSAAAGVIASVRQTIATIKEEIAGIHGFDLGSPSKYTRRVGRFLIEGLAIGLTSNDSIISAATSSLTSSVKKQLDNLFIDDAQPVIRPILDLSGVIEDANKLDSLFGDKSVGSYGRRGKDSDEEKGKTINYTQNNYSPKALSRLDIYRQTRRQLQAFSH